MVQQKAIKQGRNVHGHNFITWCMLQDLALQHQGGVATFGWHAYSVFVLLVELRPHAYDKDSPLIYIILILLIALTNFLRL